MTAPGDDVLTMLLLSVFLVSTGYAAGRLHQWYRMGTDRDEAYREGYDTATRSVFSMAVRLIGPRRPVRATATVIPGTAVPGDVTPAAPAPPGRHSDELMQAPTYRLTPDRLARASLPSLPSLPETSVKLPPERSASPAQHPGHTENPGDRTTRVIPAIPKPRAF